MRESSTTPPLPSILNLEITFRNNYDAEFVIEGADIIVDSFFDVDFVGREFKVIFKNKGTETMYVRLSAIHIYSQRRVNNDNIDFYINSSDTTISPDYPSACG